MFLIRLPGRDDIGGRQFVSLNLAQVEKMKHMLDCFNIWHDPHPQLQMA
jgi:hypothetical protein